MSDDKPPISEKAEADSKGSLAPGVTTPPASRRQWLWASGFVGLALVAGVVVFLVATHGTEATATKLTTPAVSLTVAPSPTPTPTDTPSAGATTSDATTTPVVATPAAQQGGAPVAAAQLLFPDSGAACGGNGDYSSCPVTPQMVDAANYWRSRHQPYPPEPLCRCQAAYVHPAFSVDNSLLPAGDQGNPQDVAVQVKLLFDTSHYENMVVLLAQQADGRWLAFDTYCDSTSNTLGAADATVCTVHTQ